MEKIVCIIIKIYQYCISPFLGSACRFYPSCSHYAEASIQQWGVIRGSMLALKRLAKCHPWHPGGVDLVQDPIHSSSKKCG